MELGVRSPGGAAASKHADPSPCGPSPSSSSVKVVSGEQLVKNAQKKAKVLAGGETMAEVKKDSVATITNSTRTPSRGNHMTPHSIAMETGNAPMEMDMSAPPTRLVRSEPQIKQEPTSSEQLEAVVEFCSEALGRGVLSLLDLRNRLLLKQTSLAGETQGHVLSQQSVSDRLLEEGLGRCGAIEVGQPCNKRLFAFTHGDPVSYSITSDRTWCILYSNTVVLV